ncbi:MAG: type IV secretion protein DotA, partial [Alphaproteobacteria bacterium]|nr:type IV secretion protein DotA [Alphaproteobacteria bacterium]
MAGITRRDFVNYALLPGFRPRLQELFISGFRYIPFFMALVYQAVRLLPQGHPYTLPENLGRFGIRHVIGEAANHLVFRWKNIDQIVLFLTMLAGVVVVLVQVILLAISLISQPVMANMPTNYRDFFITQNAPHDLAFMMLDLTFGIPDFFGSCVDRNVGVPCVNHVGTPIAGSNNQWILAGLQWPFPIHQGLHQMLQMYSIGLLIVATMITCYFIVTILMETAESGTAFGKRFNRVWAPIRIVVAFGLLIPVGYGLNSSQYIVLYAAKFGSGFATNGWRIFNDVLSGTYVDSQKLISKPKIPEINGFLQFMYTAATCYELERLKNKVEITPYVVRDSANPANNALPITPSVTYQQLINFTNGDSQAIIRFGIRSRENYSTQKGFVRPICGEVILTVQDPRSPANAANPPDRGPEIMQRLYFAIIKELWYETFDGQAPARNSNTLAPYAGYWYTYNTVQRYTQWDADPNAQEPPPQYKSDLLEFYKEDIKTA